MYCQQPSELSIPSARPKAGGEGLLCRHQDAAAWPQEPEPGQPLLCTGVSSLALADPVQMCASRCCLSMPCPEAQIPTGIWEPPPETVKLRCLNALQILA